jgi:hypothetical protein
MIAARLANIKFGDNVGNQWGGSTATKAAQAMKVSDMTVERGRRVLREGSKDS